MQHSSVLNWVRRRTGECAGVVVLHPWSASALVRVNQTRLDFVAIRPVGLRHCRAEPVVAPLLQQARASYV